MSAAPLATPATATTGDRGHLLRLRRLVISVLALAVALSLTANVLAAQPSVIGRAVAAWPPLALIITTDLISRVPARRRGLGAARQVAAVGIAGIAACLSYGHMATVADRAGAGSAAAHVLPLTVDGMAIVASLCLVEIGTRLRTHTLAPAASRGVARRARPAAERLDQGGAQLVRPAPRPAASRSAVERPAATAGGVGDLVRGLAAQHPDWTQAQLADRAGCSVRTVRRHLVQPHATEPTALAHIHPPTPTSTDTHPSNDNDDDSEAAA